ncbi:alpha/beta hydrolase [Sphingomonas sp. LB-2]|nr:alpha/beta hydrolase [Sphingomonas caeni]MCW3846585.1 alpha/beta hydrolase [Sphingomonas caeni]
MEFDRRSLLGMAAGAAILSTREARAGNEPERILLWPGTPSGAPEILPVEEIKEWGSDPANPDRSRRGIARPWIEVFRPARPNGAAMMVIPGGGYAWVWMEKEGYDVARWLAGQGYTAFVLTYRLPGEGWADRANVPLADAQRGVRLIRSQAKAYGIDPERVGVMGFSAGGHLAADLLARFAAKTYAPVDDADALPARPFLAAPIYPVISMSAPYAHPGSRDALLGPNPSAALEAEHSPDRNVPADAPPCFIVHADEDFVPTENSLLLHAAMRARKRPVELHIFGEGGHGFALRNIAGKPVSAWPDLFLRWAKAMGLPR